MLSMIGPRACESSLFCYPIVSSIKHCFPVRLIFVTRKLDHRHIHTRTKKEASRYILNKMCEAVCRKTLVIMEVYIYIYLNRQVIESTNALCKQTCVDVC